MIEEKNDESVLKKIGRVFGIGDEEQDRIDLAKRVLGNVEKEVGFRVGDEKVILGLKDLADFLATISKNEFAKYIDKDKNDFAWWIENSVGDEILGKRIGKLKDPVQMANEINTRIKELKPYLNETKFEGAERVAFDGKGEGGAEADGDKDAFDSEKESGRKNEKKVEKKTGEKNIKEDKEEKEEYLKKKSISSEERAVKVSENKNSFGKSENLKIGIKGKKAENVPFEKNKEDKKKDNDKEKSVAELLAEEGVVASEAPEDEGVEEEKPKTINDVLMTIEKIDGKLEMFDQFRKSSDARAGDLAERIGELRQMLMDKERDFNEVQSGFEKINVAIGDIKPNEITTKLEKAALELEKRDAKIEKLENQMATLMDEIGEYRKRMARIKDFDNLIDSLNNIKEEVVKIEDSKNYTDRIAAKSEHIFSELNEKVLLFKNQMAKVDKTDAITQELLISTDKISADMEKLASKDDLDNFKGEMQAMKFGVSKEDFGKSVAALEAEVVKVNDRLEKLDFKTKGSGELLKERERLEAYIEKTNKDYEDKKITHGAYLELIKSSKVRLEEIDGILKRLDREAMYRDLNKMSKVVNDLVADFGNVVERKDFEKVVGSVADLEHKLGSSRIEKSIENLQEAKTNIFGRLGTIEGDVRDLDLRVRNIAKLKDDIVSFKNLHRDFESLISGNISEFDAVKGVLSGLENKLEGDLKGRIEKLEFSVTERDEVGDKKLKIARDEMEMMVKDKLKSLALFGEEIKALREGKSMMFDKINSNERGLESVNSLLNSLRGELRVFGPKVSAIENNVEGNLIPSVVQLRSKMGDLDLLKSDLDVLKLRVSEVVEENLEEKIKELNREIINLKKGVYGE